MGPLNASPLVLRILFWIVGVLYLIAGACLVIFLPTGRTLKYLGIRAVKAPPSLRGAQIPPSVSAVDFSITVRRLSGSAP